MERLDHIDVLMLDDIQFLAGKDKTQEIFHNIFNEFHSKQKQIIVTCDQPPKSLTLLEARLQSRFALGMVADMKAPDFETRIAIIESKLKKKGEQLDAEFISCIAETVDTNVRELE
jgi:chromosomal replication initiator protein